MDTLIETSCLSCYIATVFRKFWSGSKSKKWMHSSAIPHFLWLPFHNYIREDNKKRPNNWDYIFNKHCELPPEEFQFGIEKQWKKPADCSEEQLKLNHNPPSDQK